MLIKTLYAVACAILFFVTGLSAQENNIGTIKGSVIDESANRPIEFVNVVLRNKRDSSIVTGKISDEAGKFNFDNIAAGEYFVNFGLIGYKDKRTPLFIIDPQHKHVNLGEVALVVTEVNLNEVLVTAEKSMYNNSIDRKVYNVGQDVMSKAGSASELLQNVPSVQVDLDGNVSLRGSSNVQIMINGKSSPLMDKNSSTALQEMPASSIEKIEVITNPSAKYKPDGTSGIINIVLKKNTTLGINGNIAGNAGNQDRYNGNLRLNYNPGSFNFYASYGARKDNRNRINTDSRKQTDSASTLTFYNENLNSHASPLSHIVSLGLDYSIDKQNQFGISGNYFHNSFTRNDNADKILKDSQGITVNHYERDRLDYEYQKEYGITTYFEHSFPEEDHKLRLEFNLSRSPEQEDNHYTNMFVQPANGNEYDNTLIKNSDDASQLTLEYSRPLTEQSSMEARYAGEFNSNDLDFYAEYFDPGQQQFVKDVTKTNRFLYDESLNAFYATYKQSFGEFGIQGGIRLEQANVTSNLVTLDSIIINNHLSMYPTLHMSYKLNRAAELQLSYSRRVHRPGAEDLNPFPEYRDPRNVSSGNPMLLPEYIHSVELGCQLQYDQISVLPALYYRYTYNRFTSLTQALNDTTLLTTKQNLSSDQSGGLEIIVSANLGDLITAHWSMSGFMNQIDASNLGYVDKKSITTWNSNLTFSLNLAKSSKLQINSSYNSSRLTPQGESSPSYVLNSGFKQELFNDKLSVILTVTDIFKTQKRELVLNTPALTQTVINTRDSRIVFLGFTYYFGIMPKKSKEEQLHYDDNL